MSNLKLYSFEGVIDRPSVNQNLLGRRWNALQLFSLNR